MLALAARGECRCVYTEHSMRWWWWCDEHFLQFVVYFEKVTSQAAQVPASEPVPRGEEKKHLNFVFNIRCYNGIMCIRTLAHSHTNKLLNVEWGEKKKQKRRRKKRRRIKKKNSQISRIVRQSTHYTPVFCVARHFALAGSIFMYCVCTFLS